MEAAFLLSCFSDCSDYDTLNDVLSASLDWLCRILFRQGQVRKIVDITEELYASPRFMDLKLEN